MRHVVWREVLWPVVLLAGFALAGAYALRAVETAFDEQHYLMTAREISRAGWDSSVLASIQPPLGLWPAAWTTIPVPDDSLYDGVGLWRARATMLAAGIAGGGLLYAWLRCALGRAAALLGLACYCVHPILIGYSALVCVDIFHASATLLLAWTTWRVVTAPSMLRHAAAGAALGLALGTKYFAVFDVPVIAGACAFAQWRSSRDLGSRRAVLRGAFAPLLAAGAALVMLHACYGFSAPMAGSSHAWWQAALPEPFAAGLNFARKLGAAPHSVYLNGSYADGHADYYLWSLLLKSPLAWLALLVAAPLLRARSWWRDPDAIAERRVVAVCLALTVAQLGCLSLLTSFQLGIRYMLPVLPLCCAIAACTARHAPVLGRGLRWSSVAAWTLVVLAGVEAWKARGDPIAYFNALGGGQRLAYRRFDDSNCDWLQGRRRGREGLLARHGDALAILHPGDGPRLGKVAAYVADLSSPDPGDPSRSRHWLDEFEPVDHETAAWFVFDVDASVLRGHDLAIALLGAGRVAAARALLPELDPTRAAALQRLAELVERASPSMDERRELISSWLHVDRPDLAVQAAAGIAAAQLGSARTPLLLALARLHEHDALAAIVLALPPAERTPDDVLLLAQSLHADGHLLEAMDLFQQHELVLRRAPSGFARLALGQAHGHLEQMPTWVRALLERRRIAGETDH